MNKTLAPGRERLQELIAGIRFECSDNGKSLLDELVSQHLIPVDPPVAQVAAERRRAFEARRAKVEEQINSGARLTSHRARIPGGDDT